jgi:hypothetical protein
VGSSGKREAVEAYETGAIVKERIEELAKELGNVEMYIWSDAGTAAKLTELVNEALEMAANTCEDQSVWADTYKCAAAIRKLKV